jgi:hypothetical protein
MREEQCGAEYREYYEYDISAISGISIIPGMIWQYAKAFSQG